MANYLNRPSIFEIATAFEDGQEGEIKQKDAGLNSSRAKEFGDAHENIPNNEAKTMDLHNNSVGYHLGNQAIINGWSEEELLNQVINAANNGKLQIGL